jgi:hypothetical protein
MLTDGTYSNLVRHLKLCVGKDDIRRLESELSTSREKPRKECLTPASTTEPAFSNKARSEETISPGPGRPAVPVTIVPDWSSDLVLNADRSFSPRDYATLVNAIKSAPVNRVVVGWEYRLIGHVAGIMSEKLLHDEARDPSTLGTWFSSALSRPLPSTETNRAGLVRCTSILPM